VDGFLRLLMASARRGMDIVTAVAPMVLAVLVLGRVVSFFLLLSEYFRCVAGAGLRRHCGACATKWGRVLAAGERQDWVLYALYISQARHNPLKCLTISSPL
jgi:hypothetical protein